MGKIGISSDKIIWKKRIKCNINNIEIIIAINIELVIIIEINIEIDIIIDINFNNLKRIHSNIIRIIEKNIINMVLQNLTIVKIIKIMANIPNILENKKHSLNIFKKWFKLMIM